MKKFPVSTFILGEREQKIEVLWREFYRLYCVMRQENLTFDEIDEFEYQKRNGKTIAHGNQHGFQLDQEKTEITIGPAIISQ